MQNLNSIDENNMPAFSFMIKKFNLTLFFFLIVVLSQGQNRNSIWCFGDSAGIDFRNVSNPIPISSGMDGRGGCSGISDSLGNLLFYSYSFSSLALTKILNANNSLMPNSNRITGWGLYNDNIIIPRPGSDHEYYNFYLGSGGNVDTTYYALVDMNLNGGLGAVVKKNVPIGAYRGGDCLTAVKHANGRDWWIVGKLSSSPITNNNRFFVYLITPDSIYSPLTFSFGGAKDIDLQKIIWHFLNDRFMVINVRGYMSEFNFDRCTGQISLSQIIFPETSSTFSRPFWEGAYSTNGNLFYVSRTSYGGNSGQYNYLLQYNLTSLDIPASCDTLDRTLYPPTEAGAVRRGPDGKIYYSQPYIPTNALNFPYPDSMRNSINENLGVINYPDSLGSTCDFRPFSFYLGGKRTYWGLPNNPEYDLGPVVGSVCDSLSNGLVQLRPTEESIVVYPNPFTNQLNCQLKYPTHGKIIFRNNLGQEVFSTQISESESFNLSSLAEGIYFIEIISEKGIHRMKVMKVK